MNIFEKQINLQNVKNVYALIFAKIFKIKSQKFAILDCATIFKDFQKRSST
jgi:hypothetical protein